MQYIETEVLPEVPVEVLAEDAEASAPLAEASTGRQQTYTSSELAGFFGVSDRSIRSWIARVKECWYSLESQLMVDGRYTVKCYQLLADYKAACYDGDEKYPDYRSRVWQSQKGTKPATTDTAIVLSAHRDETLATRQLQEGARVLDGVKEDLRQAYKQQPTLARALAKRFAANFKQEFAQAYAEEVSQAVSEVLEVSQFER